MGLVKTSGLLGLVAFALIASAPASAQDPGWYLGAGIGRSRAKIDDAQIISGLEGAGIATTGIDDQNRDTGWKVFTGYQFNRYFALEGGYFDLGRFGFNATTRPPGTLNGEITLRGLNLDAVGNRGDIDLYSLEMLVRVGRKTW